MEAASILLILAAAGVNYGWQPAENAAEGYEYTVQVEPELLDVLRSGESLPIESNVPPEVTPIRKVKIVVGRGDVERVSRDAVNHTAYFAGQPGWSPGSTSPPPAAAPSHDRYAQPPSVAGRTRSAISETGNALRDGFEAGVQAANEQIQSWNNNAGQQLQNSGNHLRSAAEQTLGLGGGVTPARTNPFSSPPPASPPSSGLRRTKAVAPPPWDDPSGLTAPSWDDGTSSAGAAAVETTTPGFAPVRTESGWTSIGTTVAAPPMLVPQLTTSTNAAPPRETIASRGPALTPPALQREPIHSVLTDSSHQTTTGNSAADSWANNWSNAGNDNPASPATISRNGDSGGRYGDSGGNVAPLQTTSGPANSQQQAANSWADLWGDKDPWAEPPQQSQPATPPAQTAATNPAANPNAGGQQVLMPPSNSANQAATNTAPPATQNPAPQAAPAPVAPANEPPWLPLLLVSVSLAGSLGANLFLGWSYMDARQKYRTLVRKTADKFRRASAAA